MPALPSGIVTFLFTDIAGSTALWERYPSEMGAASARHDAIVDSVVAAHAGVLVRPRGEGDSRFAVFARPRDAVAAAAALQQALHAEPWAVGPLRVRLALHSGEAELRDGDYYGSAVNRCARLRAAAHGGQTLLSMTTAELIGGALPTGVTLRDLGEHQLKDLLRPERIFQLNVANLPETFPPLSGVEARAHNLPDQLTPLIGRDAEVTSIVALLRASEVRLVTLTGPGGIGKTRLSLQVGADLHNDFSDGVALVELAPLRDAELVEATIARVLGVRETGGQPLHESLVAYLRERHLLLLLDNFEQVVAAAPSVATLLAACPTLSVLTTSRVALKVRGEREVALRPLALPDRRQAASTDALLRYPAVALFVARAQEVKADFVVTPATAPAIVEICHRLDGLPLAIELAAARVKLLSPPALLTRLERRLQVLVGGPADLPARQQTLRNAIAWSYELLGPEEQALFRSLAIFAGSCSMDAVEAMHTASVLRGAALLDGLGSLVDKSLLQTGEYADGEPRFTMLETMREYGLEQLDANSETAALRRAHADHYRTFALAAEPELRGPEQAAWLERLEREHDNLRAVLAWSLEAGEIEMGLRIGGVLWRFWWTHGHLTEGRRWLESLLDRTHAPATDQPLIDGAVRAKALHGAGFLARFQGDFRRAAALLEESLDLYRSLDDARGVATSLVSLGAVTQWQGEYDRAAALLEEGVALYRALDDRQSIPQALQYLGSLLILRHEYARATEILEESAARYRALGDSSGLAPTLNLLGEIAREQGYYHQATQYYEESLALFRDLRDTGTHAAILVNLGLVAHALGEHDRAQSLFLESLGVSWAVGARWMAAYALEGMAEVAAAVQRLEQSAHIYSLAQTLREAMGTPLPPTERDSFERTIAAIKAALGAEDFAAAWAAGRSLPLDQAIEQILSAEPPSTSVQDGPAAATA